MSPVTGLEIIAAPSSLGLRPPAPDREPGAWRAPEVLLSHGLAERLGTERVTWLPHPAYDFDAQPGTRIRNGRSIRDYSLSLSDAVQASLEGSRFPLVLGGDCSVLLGCLVAARLGGRCGLIHVDGHSDFFHPNNYDTTARLGTVAGMDLALATGRGEPVLTHWPLIGIPLVDDADAIQLGDREAAEPDLPQPWSVVPDTTLVQLTIGQLLDLGIDAAATQVTERLGTRRLDRVWLHVDLDVLDQAILPAVDTPGSPGLDTVQLAGLIGALVRSRRVIGLDVTIYDPDRDEGNRHAPLIVECLAAGLA